MDGGILAVATTQALADYQMYGSTGVLGGGTLAFYVGGTGWAATDIATFLKANGPYFNAGSSLGFDTTNANFTYGAISGNMGLTKLGSNTLTLTGVSTYAGPTLISGGTLQFGDGTNGGDGSIAGTAGITDNATLTYNLFAPQTYSGAISGSGNLIKTGGGTLTLAATNSFSGTTTVNGGSLILTSDSALLDSSVILNTAGNLVFDKSVASNAFTLGGLGGAANLGLVNNAPIPVGIALTVGGNNNDTAYSGAITGLGSVTKVGSGTLTLTGVSLYAGATTINGGTLQFGDGAAGHDGVLLNATSITDNATLAYDLAGTQTYSGVITGSGNLTKTGNGVLTLGSASLFSGTTFVGGGTLVVANTGTCRAALWIPAARASWLLRLRRQRLVG